MATVPSIRNHLLILALAITIGAAEWNGRASRSIADDVSDKASNIPHPDLPLDQNPLLVPEAARLSPEILERPASAEEEAAIAAELDRLQTRDASQLVAVISEATRANNTPLPASFLISIAFAETRGRILAVSPSGAAGLAQATPAAYAMEGLDGKLWITTDYLVGTRAYIMKKPLGDALNIAEQVTDRTMARQEAIDLLGHAKELRQVGLDELKALEPFAPERFAQRIRRADEYNREVLEILGHLLESGAPREIEEFRDQIRDEYRALHRIQKIHWQKYAKELEWQRDRMLREHFRDDPIKVIRTRGYEAGEYLGEHLDARFSPTKMAWFLAAHATTKRDQAIALGVPEDELESWTAALYNGGLVNVARMRAGLISAPSETVKYMQKVPETRFRLDGVAALSVQ